MKHDGLFMSDAQLAAELERCEYCEEKPCMKACPADCSPADFIMAARGMAPADFKRSAALIMSKNPLGGVCGTTCPDTHCQAACSHKGFDRPIEIPMLQSAIIARAKAWDVMPHFDEVPASGHRVAVVGAGPAGLGAAAVLAQNGCEVDVFEREARPGGAVALIPPHRLEPTVLSSDIDWLTAHSRIELKLQQAVDDPAALLQQGYAAVVVAAGLYAPIALGIPGEDIAIAGNTYLAAPDKHPCSGTVAVIGGGAIACDCAVTAQRQGAGAVEMFTLETVGEMPLTAHEMRLLFESGIQLTGRTKVTEILVDGQRVSGLKTLRVELPAGEAFHPAKVRDCQGSEQTRAGFNQVLIAIGHRAERPVTETPGVFFSGDGAFGPSTVVEAVAMGKNTAVQVAAYLRQKSTPAIERPNKSTVRLPGYRSVPVPLDVDFFGRRLRSPFLLSAAPPTDGYDQMKQALDAGWAGGIMKTAFDGLPIHIPADYMHVFDGVTYGNCDNVSDHALDRVCEEIGRLVREYPDRLIAASTGGPVSGDDAADRKGWQGNARKLEEAGAMAVEFSLSCPQGGDGTEGDIVSQSAPLTATIVDWIMQTSRPDVPKLFKLTGAVTSVAVIVRAIKEVLDRFPDKQAGITLANTFPTLAFRPRNRGAWDEGVLVGMSGMGVAPISNLTLASVAGLGVTVSGNGGPMDYRSAAHFLALGARSVQFCTVAMKYGVGIVDELHSGLSHLMQARGIASVEELIGIALPEPITDFMALSPTKRIPQVLAELCQSCGNCTRCSYHAVALDAEQHPTFAADRCIGCSLCTKKCFAGALSMRERRGDELRA